MADEAKATKQVWRGSHWATVAADSKEATAIPAAPGNPATPEALAELEAEALADVKKEITGAFADLATDFAQHVATAKEELRAAVDQAKADLNTLLSGAIDQLDEKIAAAATPAAPAAEAPAAPETPAAPEKKAE